MKGLSRYRKCPQPPKENIKLLKWNFLAFLVGHFRFSGSEYTDSTESISNKDPEPKHNLDGLYRMIG
jgi:hypothetical protein